MLFTFSGHIFYCLQLYNALDSRDQTIGELEKKLESVFEFRGEHYEEDGSLYSELEQSRNEVIQYRKVVSELQAKLGNNKTFNDSVKLEINQLKQQVQSQRKLIESQRKQIQEAGKTTEYMKKQHRSGTGEQYRLETENQR